MVWNTNAFALCVQGVCDGWQGLAGHAAGLSVAGQWPHHRQCSWTPHLPQPGDPTATQEGHQGQFGLCLVLTMQQSVSVIKVSLVYASCWPRSNLSVSSRSVWLAHIDPMAACCCSRGHHGWFDLYLMLTPSQLVTLSGSSWSVRLAPHIAAFSWSVWLAHHIDPIAAGHCIRVIKVSLTCTSHWSLCNLPGSSRLGLKRTLFLVAGLTPAMILHHSVTSTCCGLQLAIFLTCIFQGHMKPITAMAVSSDKTTAFTGSQEGISILCKLFSPDFTLLWKQQTQQTMFDGGLGGWWVARRLLYKWAWLNFSFMWWIYHQLCLKQRSVMNNSCFCLLLFVCMSVFFLPKAVICSKPHHMWKGFCLDQRSVWWDVATGNNDVVTGTGHSNEVTDMVVDGDNLISVGIDDTVRFTSVAARQFRSVVWWWQCDGDKSACMILYYHLGIPAEKKKEQAVLRNILLCSKPYLHHHCLIQLDRSVQKYHQHWTAKWHLCLLELLTVFWKDECVYF